MFIEFSYPFTHEATIVESSIKPPTVVPRSRFAGGGHSNTSYIEMFAHAGTHIDAPWHFVDSGPKILDFSVGDFVFSKVRLIDLPNPIEGTIGVENLLPFIPDLLSCDALLIRTGFGKLRVIDPIRYISGTPGFTLEAAKLLAGIPNLRCLGVDWISVENVALGRQIGFPIHLALLGRSQPMILLEDPNFEVLPEKGIKRIYLFPLRFEDLEASPVTAVAEI